MLLKGKMIEHWRQAWGESENDKALQKWTQWSVFSFPNILFYCSDFFLPYKIQFLHPWYPDRVLRMTMSQWIAQEEKVVVDWTWERKMGTAGPTKQVKTKHSAGAQDQFAIKHLACSWGLSMNCLKLDSKHIELGKKHQSEVTQIQHVSIWVGSKDDNTHSDECQRHKSQSCFSWLYLCLLMFPFILLNECTATDLTLPCLLQVDVRKHLAAYLTYALHLFPLIHIVEKAHCSKNVDKKGGIEHITTAKIDWRVKWLYKTEEMELTEMSKLQLW